MMRRKSKRKFIIVTSLLVIVMTVVGYAYLRKTLPINGNTTVAKNTWSVKFTTITPVKNDGTLVIEPTVTGDTTLTFAEKLNTPGDEYIFYVKVENQGSIDAMVSGTPTLTGLEDMSDYLDYSVTYIDGVPIQSGNLLAVDGEDIIRVRLFFKKNITEEDISSLATADVTNTMRLSINYVQKNNTATERNKMTCIRAYTLHQTTCQYTSGTSGCLNTSTGHTTGSTITYGHTDSSKLVSASLENGTSVGYALTCDVNDDNVYSEETERFYYVSDMMYYDTTNSTVAYDSNYATLIYYSNVLNKVATPSSILAYYTSAENWHGASSEFMSNMPTNTDWKNTLKRDSNGNSYRQIVNQNGTVSATIDGTKYNYPNYDYTAYGGRLLTYQEVVTVCGGNINLHTKCEFLMENTRYEKGVGPYGY